jgi:5-methyltetrahydropteroyltriglutamate--homocysteine methyltransferase
MPVVPQLIGYPRIGPRRELKWALERMWDGRMARPEFEARIAELREAHLAEQRDLVGSAVDDFFLYDEALETGLMLGIAPDELVGQLETDPFAVLTALSRGTPQREAWEMTKWFDTNYHYVVPEIAEAGVKPTWYRALGAEEVVPEEATVEAPEEFGEEEEPAVAPVAGAPADDLLMNEFEEESLEELGEIDVIEREEGEE